MTWWGSEDDAVGFLHATDSICAVIYIGQPWGVEMTWEKQLPCYNWLKDEVFMQIANPIYDVIFKYLLDDNKIAKKLISLIINEEIETLELKPTEIRGDLAAKPITVLHIDFSATIKLPDGGFKKIIIELQKAKFFTDIQRFRRYLGSQYGDSGNSYEKHGRKVAMPILSIYFLGHYLEKTRLPVVRVNRQYIDVASGKLILEKDPFIEALTHDSIVIQIPALKEHRRNKLEKVLSVFESSTAKNHLINIREEEYPKQFQAVIRRLLKAAAEPELRESMNIEDEYVEELESLERTIDKISAKVDEISAENKKIAAERDKISVENEQIAAEKDKVSAEKDRVSAENKRISAEKDRILQVAIEALMKAKGISYEQAKKLLT
jgi:hypothetical protein